jgi:hypothetical protein
MIDVKECERAVADLEGERLALVGRRRRADAEMQRLAFRAHCHGDVEASAALGELREEAIRRDQKIAEVEGAITAALERLQQARQAAREGAPA